MMVTGIQNIRKILMTAIQKPSLFISIFIIFELFPVLGLKIAPNLIEDKKSIVNVLFKEDRKGLTPVVKEQELSIIGSTEKYMFFYDHSDCSKIVMPKNKIITIKPSPLVKTANEPMHNLLKRDNRKNKK